MSKKKQNPVQEAPVQKKQPLLSTKGQQEVLKRHGLSVTVWEVVTESGLHLSLRHRLTGERKVIRK